MSIIVSIFGVLGTILIGSGFYDVFEFNETAEIPKKEPIWFPRTVVKVQLFGGATLLVTATIGGIVLKILGVM